jgi:hypothetical protein
MSLLKKLFKNKKVEPPVSIINDALISDKSLGDYLIDTSKKGVAAATTPADAVSATSTVTNASGQPPVTFESWYAALPEDDKKRVDQKLARLRDKMGTPVVCSKCGHPGGKIAGKGYTLKKIGDSYVHMGPCPEVK